MISWESHRNLSTSGKPAGVAILAPDQEEGCWTLNLAWERLCLRYRDPSDASSYALHRAADRGLILIQVSESGTVSIAAA